MKKINIMLLLSMGSMLQGMEQTQTVSPTSDSETTSQSDSANILSMDYFWSHASRYLLYNGGPQVATQTIKASSCVDNATFAVFKNTRLKDLLINLFQQYALYSNVKKEEVLDSLFPVLYSNAQQARTLYAGESATIEAFVETLKSCAQSKDWSPALAQLEVIRKEPRLVLQLNKAYWDVNPLVRITVLSHALLLNAPKELVKSLIDCKVPLTNPSPKILPPLLIMVMKTTGPVTIDPKDILGEEVVSAIPNEVADRTYVKELITLLCASGAQILDCFNNSSTRDPFLNSLSALEWAIVTHDNDLLEYLLVQQKDIQQRKALLGMPAMLAVRTVVCDQMIPSVNDIQRLSGEECFKLLLQNSKNDISELFGLCSHAITGFQSIPGLPATKAAELAESIIRILSILIEYGANINHLTDKKAILDKAQDEGWHKDIIDFLIKKGADKSSCELTQEEIKAQTIFKAVKDILPKYIMGQTIEQEKIRDLLKVALEIVKSPSMDFGAPDNFHFACILAIDLGASLEETLEFLTCSESRNLFSSDSPSYGDISSVFHKIVSWLSDVKRACHEIAFNELIKRESLRSLLVKLAEKGVKDKPNSEGKTAAQKAYELGFEEIANLISDSVSKS